MANVIITGTIKEIKDAQVFGSFEKREFWITEVEGQYPNTYALEAQQAFCNELDKHNIGELVECSVDVRGRHWSKGEKEGVMNTLKCWKMVSKGALTSQHYQRPNSQPSYMAGSGNTDAMDIPNGLVIEEDGLPF